MQVQYWSKTRWPWKKVGSQVGVANMGEKKVLVKQGHSDVPATVALVCLARKRG